MSKLLKANAMEKRPLVIVGAGMAAPRLVEVLEARAPGRYAVPLAGAELRPPYDRVLLSLVPDDKIAVLEIGQKATAWRRAAGVEMPADAKIEATLGSLKYDAPLLLEAA